MESYIALALFGSFFILVFIGVPISFSIGIATVTSMALMFPWDIAIITVTQRLANGLDNFALLAIPFFIFAGILMNSGGIAIRLINLAQVMVGRVPGSLGHVNVLANMMFGSISGSAVAAAAAVGGTLDPIQKKEGYAPEFSTAINVSSCITGLLIPPSNVLIVFSLTAGGVSVASLFMAGYLPGILMGFSIMLVCWFLARKRNYPLSPRPTTRQALKALLDALPSLLLVFIVMGGILGGVFTATEASAIAVVYTFILSVLIYREVKWRDLPKLILESVVTTSIVLLLIGCSVGMSWAMTNADIPYLISDAMMGISDNPLVILLMINVVLLVVGIFMDMTPAVLIFTPIFLPIAQTLGMDPVHFGIMMVANLCIGLLTPPVGSALFVGCSISGVKLQNLIKPLLPFYAALFISLMMITYIPEISLFIPKLLGLM
ncbi:TRAP transporter large permease [Mangrovibacter plantisponsor]|uniref:TRAP transporter large permease protein n=1 Tax=Mangrovibacter plantisponsor TaxID=451513 RepID=A0A317Q9S7_9ENTR|nr:TRAP transporter large permease subunit [Mangrovibacter plantisponsor]PWW12914.1 tripartite ATP-independent transporter DctM subunit [Mangrovibacter plantisponsor]